MSVIAIRRLALVWWVKNLRAENPVRATRWERLAERYGKEADQ